jgi:hypothetical protein
MNMDSMKSFLELASPSKTVQISALATEKNSNGFKTIWLNLPLIELVCDTESCGGKRLFESNDEIRLENGKSKNFFILYTCRNCRKFFKHYSLLATLLTVS